MDAHARACAGKRRIDVMDSMHEHFAKTTYSSRSASSRSAAILSANAAGDKYDIVGQYEAFVVVTYVDAKIARQILPTDFELAPPSDTPPRMHPVMYSFGKHRHVHPRRVNAYEYDYDEALVGLPHVGIRQGGKLFEPFFHMTAVRLNNAVATAIGVALGFPKKMATIENTDSAYAITMGSTPIMLGETHVTGKKFKNDHPNFKLISPMMQQPVISKTKLGSITTTAFSIDTANAFMTPAKMQLDVLDDSLAGLPKGVYEFDSIDTKAFGGAYMSIHSWQMSQWPLAIL